MPDAAHVFRMRRSNRPSLKVKGYRHTLEAVDERTGMLRAECDLVGRATGGPLEIREHVAQGGGDDDVRTWRLVPDRPVMPRRWTLFGPDARIVLQFDGMSMVKLANPLGRCALSVLGADGKELHRLIDPRSGVVDRVFGIGPDAWALVNGPQLVASLGPLPAAEPSEPSRPGLLGRFGKLSALLARADRGLVSVGDDHVLPAPAAVAMTLLLDELTDTSGG